MLTEARAIDIVTRNGGGAIEGCYGPQQVAGLEVWEIWTHDGDEYAVRFVSTAPGTKPQYHAAFGELCVELGARHDEQQRQLATLATDRHGSLVRLYVAATVFMASVGVLLYLLLARPTHDAVLIASLSALVANGGMVFYGVWRSPWAARIRAQ